MTPPIVAIAQQTQTASAANVGQGGAHEKTRASYVMRSIMHLFVILLCVTPSVLINVNAQIGLGAGYDMISAVVGFGVLAPILALNAAECIRLKKWISCFFWGALASVFIVLNTVLALGGYSAVRESVMDGRAAQMRKAEADSAQLKDAEQSIAELRKVAGVAAPDMIQATIDGMKANRIYARTSACTDATRKDSQRFCQALANERSRLAAANEIRRLQTMVNASGWRASTSTETPATKDPQIENLTALTVALFGLKIDHRLMAAMLSVFLALMTEILADLGPIAVLFAARSIGKKNRKKDGLDGLNGSGSDGVKPSIENFEKPLLANDTKPSRPTPKPRQIEPDCKTVSNNLDVASKSAPELLEPSEPSIPEPSEPSIRDPFSDWMEDRVSKKRGASVGFSVIRKSYEEWSKANGHPMLTDTMLGRKLRAAGVKKDKVEGLRQYVGIYVRGSANLKVVK